MAFELDINFVRNQRAQIETSTDPIKVPEATDLLGAKIVIAGINVSDVAFMQSMLQISGFTNIQTANDDASLMLALRHGIQDDYCDIDLLVLSSDFTDISVNELRAMMDQFDEWRLIPIIALTQDSQWDHAQVMTDLGLGVTSLFYHPLTAESFPPAVMTALAVKKERDETYQKQLQLEDELSSLRVMEARLKFSVNHDDLTGLSNRRHLEQSLQTTLTQVRNFKTSSALFCIDLDRFKVLNDSCGHEAGDALLVQVANSLRTYFGTNDIIVRIGSDEFAVLVDHIIYEKMIEQAQGLRELFDGYSFEYLGQYFHLSASIGIKFINADEENTVGGILGQSNQACYTAKKRGRNRFHVFSKDDREMHSLRHSVQWAPRIRTALKQENFILEFQPIYDLESEIVTHFECLIRMRCEDGSVYFPNDFIPVAERMGLIHQIDFWVIDHAFDLIKTLKSSVAIAINLSGNIFLDESLYDLIDKKIKQTGIDPSRMVLEITETAAISNFEQTKAMVTKLRELGCRFALDDFGAGFNSYNYIKHFPVDILKIDGSFITNLVNDPVDQLLVKSMIDIAHSLDKKVVAEFVEDDATVELLRNYGADYIQGYLVGQPQSLLPKS